MADKPHSHPPGDSHDHEHDHGHGHGHEHDHGHPHSHGEEHEHKAAGGPPAPAPVLETPVDSGSLALSEALRSSFTIVKVVMVVLLIAFFGSGLFTVREGQRAIKLRFGKPVGQGEEALLRPGLHWSWPYPIEDYEIIPITAIQNVTSSVGWFYVTTEQELAGQEPPAGPSLNPAVDGYVLTSDGNIVHSRATLQFRISDPVGYIFDFSNASNAVKSALDNALLWSASRHSVDQMLTRDVIGFTESVRRRVEQLLLDQKLGVVVEQVSVQTVAPRQLREPFANVLRAEINRAKLLQEARSHENQVLSRSSAESQSRINAAESDRVRLVADVESRARQFENLLPRYRENPQLFVQQRLTDAFGRALTNVQDKIFLSQGSGNQPKELRLLLNREPARPVQNQEQGGQQSR